MKLIGCVRERLKRSLFFNSRRALSFPAHITPTVFTYRLISLVSPIIYQVKNRHGHTILFEVYQKVDKEYVMDLSEEDEQSLREELKMELGSYLEVFTSKPRLKVILLYENWMETIKPKRK